MVLKINYLFCINNANNKIYFLIKNIYTGSFLHYFVLVGYSFQLYLFLIQQLQSIRLAQ
jgi:hypothetical protein